MENLPEIRIWINRYSSEKVRKRYLKYLKSYCEFHEKSPTELLELKRTETNHVSEIMLDKFVLEWNKPESTKESAVSAIRSFYSANYLDLAKRAGSGVKYTKVKPYRNPTQDQLRDMCLGAHIRDIALINVLSSGGFRAETLRSLNWSHVSEIESWNGIDPIHVPIMGKELKGGGYGKYRDVEQHAFLTPHAIRVLLQYRAWRESRGEKIKPNSPLFATIGWNPTRLKYTRHIRYILEMACKGKPFLFSTHDLRRFTQTQLEQGRIQPNWIRKMLGKKVGGEEAPYSQPKIEQLRDAYGGAISFLTLGETENKKALLEARKRALLDSASFIFMDDPEKLSILENLLKKVSNEQEFDKAKREWQTKRLKNNLAV